MDKILTNNPIQYFVNAPGITNIRDLGEKWSDGIRSIVFRYKNKDGEYKEISSNKKSYELKCLEKETLLNQPYKQKNNRGKVKNQASETVVSNNIYTANLCENGNYNQNFYLTNKNDDKYVDDDDIYNHSNHIHFHKHPYDIEHDELENIHDI